MLIKLNFTEAEIKDLIISHMKDRGWNIEEFEWLEANGNMNATDPRHKLVIYARCEATETDS